MNINPVNKNYKPRGTKLVLKRRSVLKDPKRTQTKTLVLKKVNLDNN